MRYLRDSRPKHFQPMNSNWGLVDPLPERIRDKAVKRRMLARRALSDFLDWMVEHGLEARVPLTALHGDPDTFPEPAAEGSGAGVP
jgi:methylenetetrahydrofolate--tRNA-(uracil-5-)-methyltransferase